MRGRLKYDAEDDECSRSQTFSLIKHIICVPRLFFDEKTESCTLAPLHNVYGNLAPRTLEVPDMRYRGVQGGALNERPE